MLPWMRKMATIVDDRGASHVISWNMQAFDQTRKYVQRRVQAEFSESMGWGLTKGISLHQVVVVVGFMLVGIASTAAPMLLGVTGSSRILVSMTVMAVAIVGVSWITSKRMRATYQRAALISVEEGACGSCWYDLRATPVEPDAMCVCPECGAAWRFVRIRAGRDPLPVPREPESSETKMIRRLGIFDMPAPIKDEHARVFAVVTSRVLRLRAEASEGERRERWLSAAKAVRSAGLIRRVGGSLFFLVMGVMMLHRAVWGVPSAGAAWIDWFTWIMFIFSGIFMTALGTGRLLRSDGLHPDSAKELLLERSICPACGEMLDDAPGGANGVAVCVECSAAWRRLNALRTRAAACCPRCERLLTDVHVGTDGRPVCGKCSYVITDG